MSLDKTDGEGSRPARRFAIVVISEAADSMEAKGLLEERLRLEKGRIWLTEACPVGPAADYELMEVHLLEDRELVVTGPGS